MTSQTSPTETETPDGYTLITSENFPQVFPNGEVRLVNNYVLSSERNQGSDYDYQEPYFEPASQEEELVLQLNTKLAVTEIPREDIE